MRLLFVFVMIAICAAGGWWWWTTTPQYSVEQVKEAIKTHDLTKFNTYVDIDTVSARMVDDFLTKPMQSAIGGHGLAQEIVTGLTSLVRPLVAKGVKHEIVTFVETGSFASADEPPPPGVSLNGLNEHFGFRHHALKGIKATESDGGLARVVLLLHNQQYNQDLTLDVNMRKADGHWQVIELANFPQFCAKLAELGAGQNDVPDDQNTDPTKANGI